MPDEPLDPEARNLATLAYLITACEHLGIEVDDEWDAFMYARALYFASTRHAAHLLDSTRIRCSCGRRFDDNATAERHAANDEGECEHGASGPCMYCITGSEMPL